MNQTQLKQFMQLSDFDKAFYLLLKNLGIDVQINDIGDDINKDNFNIPESDRPKVRAVWGFVRFLNRPKNEQGNHRSNPNWDIPEAAKN